MCISVSIKKHLAQSDNCDLQIKAKWGPDSRFVIKANIKALLESIMISKNDKSGSSYSGSSRNYDP